MGRLVGRGRVGDVPPLDGCDVDSACCDRRAVGAPPVAAESVELLAGDVVGDSPRHVGILVAGQLPTASVELGDSQRAAAHVGQPSSPGVRSRIEDGSFDIQFAGHATDQPGDEQTAGERKRNNRDSLVGREGRDARCRLAHALAPDALLVRQILVGVACARRVDGSAISLSSPVAT